MDILISTALLNYTGLPTYILTLYNQLVARKHKVTVYCPDSGQLASRMNTITSLEFAGWPDVILAQHNTTLAREMKAKFHDIPMIFTSHGILPEVLEQPPTDIEIDKYIAVSEEVALNLKTYGIEAEIIRNFIDIDRFQCKEPVREKPERLLFISNYRRGIEYRTIQEACEKMGIEFRHLGYTSHPKYNVEDYINQSDIVISLSRGALESMACERPVIIYDCRGGDGYINEELYPKSIVNNLTGRTFRINFTPETLMKEIEKYDPNDGIENRKLILKHHNHVKAVDTIMEIIREMT